MSTIPARPHAEIPGLRHAAPDHVDLDRGHAVPRCILVLGGGPDREREVSLWSAKGVADALRGAGLEVLERTIDRITAAQLADMPGDVVFPVLHGSFGEGGPLQDILEAAGRAYVGCRPHAARVAMDKVATKLAAARAGVPTAPAGVLNPLDERCPIPFGAGVVLKPIHDGSSVGVHLIRRAEQWDGALAAARADIRDHPGRSYMVESLVTPAAPEALQPPARLFAAARVRELTVAILQTDDGYTALPVIHIQPTTDFYDYEAKYLRDDTVYTPLPASDAVVPIIQAHACRVAAAVGIRHLCRVDFLDPAFAAGGGEPQMLEINTMPGFTSHSLYPLAARTAGICTPDLCKRLVGMAWNERIVR